tara:strand:+ start:2604 stop:3947 length:1344 start_codon:yes stop_codon:yes gene_type:complete
MKYPHLDIVGNKPKNKVLKNLQAWKFFPWVVWGLGAFFYCYEYLLRTMPGLMKAPLTATYHLTDAQFGNLAAFYLYSYVPMQILVGVFMDRFLPRMLLSFAVMCCALGSILFASTNILAVAQAGRLLVGFGSAFAFVGVLKLAAVWLPQNRFALVAGLTSSLGPLGALLGNNFLNFLVIELGWKAVVFISVGFGFTLTYLIWFVIRDGTGRGRGKLRQPESSFGDLFNDLLVVLKKKQIWLNAVFACFGYMTLEVMADLWGTSYLHEGLGLSHNDAVFFNSLIYLGWLFGGPFFGWFSDYIKLRRLPMAIGAVCAATSFTVILFMPHSSRWVLTAMLLCVGFFSAAQALTFTFAKENAAPQVAGSVMAITNLFTMIGGAVLQPLVGVMLDNEHLSAAQFGTHVAQVDYRNALVIVPIGMVLSLVAIAFMRETHAKQQVQHNSKHKKN